MYIGFTKRLGNGWTIGMGTRVGRNAAKVNAELKAKENREFIQKVKNELQYCMIDFYTEHNIHPTIIDNYLLKVEAGELFSDTKILDKLNRIKQLAEYIQESFEKAEYGKHNLHYKTKEKVIDSIFEINKLAGRKSTSKLEEFMENNQRGFFFRYKSIFIFSIFMYVLMYISDTSELSGSGFAISFFVSFVVSRILTIKKDMQDLRKMINIFLDDYPHMAKYIPKYLPFEKNEGKMTRLFVNFIQNSFNRLIGIVKKAENNVANSIDTDDIEEIKQNIYVSSIQKAVIIVVFLISFILSLAGILAFVDSISLKESASSITLQGMLAIFFITTSILSFKKLKPRKAH